MTTMDAQDGKGGSKGVLSLGKTTTASPSPPTNASEGTPWTDPTTGQGYVYRNGTLQKTNLSSNTGPVESGPPVTNTGGSGTDESPFRLQVGTPVAQTGPSLQDLYTQPLTAVTADPTVSSFTSAGPAKGAYTSPYLPPVNIDSNPSLPGGGTGTIDSQGYDAVQRQLSEDAKASQILLEMTSQDSPLMQRAAQEGILSAARRGLQNSSLASGAAMGAMVDRATPIAVQQAQNMTSMELANLDEANRALAFSAAAKNAASLTSAQLKSQESQTIAGLKSTEAIASAQLTSQQNTTAAQIASSQAMFSAEQANQMAQFNANWANQAASLNAQLDAQSKQFNASQQNAINTQIMALNASLNEQYLRGTQALDLATIQGQWQALTTNNAVAGEILTAGFNIVGSAMANPEFDPGRIAAYVDIANNMTNQGLSFISEANKLDWSSFLPAASTTPNVNSIYGNYYANASAF